MNREPVVRKAVRVLLMDEHQQVLLFRAVNLATDLPFWFPPGGGIEEGETARQALARELFEETGLTNVAVEGEVWVRRHVFAWRDDVWDQHEQWFLACAPHFEPDTRHLNDNELADITEWRWWSLQDLAAATELLVPRDLASRLRGLLNDGVPGNPIAIGD